MPVLYCDTTSSRPFAEVDISETEGSLKDPRAPPCRVPKDSEMVSGLTDVFVVELISGSPTRGLLGAKTDNRGRCPSPWEGDQEHQEDQFLGPRGKHGPD